MFKSKAMIGLLGVVLVSAVGADGSVQPELEVERAASRTIVRVDNHELRTTTASVTSPMSGGDPRGTAAFATWAEGTERWGAFSRDGGDSWTPARPIRQEIRLRDGDTAPADPMPPAVAELSLPPASRLHLVQFRTVSLPEWRAALTELGVEVLNYVPHNAHIVRVAPERLDAILDLDFVERIEPYHPSYRLDRDLRRDLLDADTFGEEHVRVTVFEWGPAAKQRVIGHAESLGARVAEYWPSGHVVELWADRDQIVALAADDDVMWIDRWTPRESDMDQVRQDSGANHLHNSFGYCGQGVRGEVMDGGVQDDHPDFDGILLHGPTNLGSHGTATYGIVFGNGDIDGDGDGKAIGHLPCGEGIFAAYPEMTDRFAHTQELKNPPYQASFQTNSWGGAATLSYNSVSQEMDDIIWRLDIAILNSQSNNGSRQSRPEAWAKNVISVGGIRHYDTLDTADDAWAGGASIGPAADGRIKPDVSHWFDDIYTTTTGSGYRTEFGGTSAATPISAGVVGLILEMWADNVWLNDPQGATPFEKQPHFSTLKALLINNSQQYDFIGAGADLGRFKQGWGRPSAGVARERAARSLVVDETDLLELNDTATYAIDVASSETELKVTMIYPDPPGTTSASMHRINDVDLRVTSPSATLYLGNVGLEDATESATGGLPDTLNTVENVFIANPQPGTWTVEVEAVEVNQDAHLDTAAVDDVAYALVVTGGRSIATSGAAELHVAPGDVACSDTIALTVRDGNAGGGSLTVDVTSDTESTPESVTLTETNPGSGNYTGQLTIVATAPAADGDLSVADGDGLLVEYVDADDGAGGTNVTLQHGLSADCSPPQITGVWVSDLSDTEANTSWITDESSDSTVTWGASAPPGQTESRPGSVTVHNLRLTGLTECTSYFFSVSSEDPVGNVATDDNGGGYFLVTTLTDSGGQLHSCREGTLVLEADVVGCNASVPIRLTEADLDLDPGSAETVQVFVSSSTETTPEAVTLTESGPATGIFAGFVPTGTGAPVGSDGILQAAHGDWITGSYLDADDGMGQPQISVYTIEADCAPPTIAPVQVNNLTDTTATVSWTTSEPATGSVQWGTTPALGNSAASAGSQTNHSAAIVGFNECDRVYFQVTATDAYGNTGVADFGSDPFEFNGWGIPGIFHADDFETDAGWTLAGEWELGAPQGLGTAPGDPGSAFSGVQVLGHDLSGLGSEAGDYEPSSNEAATGPVIDGTSFDNTELVFRRRLNVVQGTFAYIDVRDSGGTWRQMYQTSVGGIQDSDWNLMTLDISTYADNNPDLQVRFRERSFIPSSFASGWNIDDLSFRDGSQPSIAVCGGCAGVPIFSGLVSVTDDDPCADSGVTLTWSPAPAWGTGGAGSYAIYRDTVNGFTPGPANLLAAGVTETEWVDATVPDDTDLYYLVLAENDEMCSTGPANGGVVDGNAVYAVGKDATGQVAPGDVGPTLAVDELNDAHARLTWASTAGAVAYRVYRSGQPDQNFVEHDGESGTLFDDLDVFVDGQTWYYLVRGVDACGNEGP